MTNLKRMMLVGVVLAAGVGCPKDQVCTPGEQVACACVGGAQGAQRCSDDGTVLGECACPSGSSSSSGGASSQAGTSQVATSQAGSSSSSGGVSGSNASSMSTGSSSLTASTTSAGSSTSAATSQAGTSTSVGSSGPGSSSASAGSSADNSSGAVNSSSAVNSSGVASSVMGSSSSGVESSSSLASSSTSMAPVYGGVISLLEAAFLNPGTSATFYGQGIRADIAFSQAGAFSTVLEEQPGSPLGCKAWSLTPTEAAARAVGEDLGTVGITLVGSSSPTVPLCSFTPAGYQCRHQATLSTGGTIAAGPQAGTAVLTDGDVTFNQSSTAGSHVLIQGAAIAANNGLFPILALAGANTIVFANPAMAAETLPGTAFHVNVAAAGPIPGAPDPGFLSDDATMDVSFTSNGGSLASFTANSGAGTVADDFSMDTVNLNRLNAIPSDGTPFTVACGAGSCGGGSGTGTLLTFTTTDAPTAGQSPFVLPPPVTRQVVVRCLMIGTSSVTVPAAYSDLLRTAGATRVRGEYARVTLIGGGPPSVSVMAGHSVVGHTNF